MLKSQKVNGRHFRYFCSKCHENIDPRFIFDSKCPHCKTKMSAEEGDSAKCIGVIAWGCTAECKHSTPHSDRTSDCRMSYCKAVGHMVSCVYDGGVYQLNGTTTIDLKYRLASG